MLRVAQLTLTYGTCEKAENVLRCKQSSANEKRTLRRWGGLYDMIIQIQVKDSYKNKQTRPYESVMPI